MNDLNAPPINPLPPVVWLLALPVIAMEVAVSLGASGLAGGASGIGWRLDAVQRFAFSPEYLRRMYEAGLWPADGLMRLISYPLVHLSVTHTVWVIVFLLALGKFVGEVFRWWAVLAVVFGATAVAALVYAAVPFVTAALVGGYPPVYGLIGAFTFILWTNLGQTGGNRIRAFSLIGMLLAVQLLFGLLFGGGTEWIADLAGFGAGFLLSFVVSPGGWARVMAKLRAR
jgi:membrane associated rhomboid family serine protease